MVEIDGLLYISMKTHPYQVAILNTPGILGVCFLQNCGGEEGKRDDTTNAILGLQQAISVSDYRFSNQNIQSETRRGTEWSKMTEANSVF